MSQPRTPPVRRTIQILSTALFGVVLPIGIVVGGYQGAQYLLATAPQAKRSRDANDTEAARLVETTPIVVGNHPVEVEVMGTVVPARTVRIAPQVGGRIEWVNEALVVGSSVREGEVLLQIEKADFELAVRTREAALAQAEGDYQLEMGQQAIARKEAEVLGRELSPEEEALVLRQPQLAKAEAAVASARAALDTARLDLARTEVRAPFNGLVLSESIEPGAIVSPNAVLAEVVGTDQFWVELEVPIDDLRWVALADPARRSQVRLFNRGAWGPDEYRMGRVSRLAGDVSPTSRLARLIVEVDDPMALQPENAGEPILLLNTYLRAHIDGEVVKNVASIPRDHLREVDSLWIMTSNGTLDIRPVEVAWRGRDQVLISLGVTSGEKLVTTDLSMPIQGMTLRESEERPARPVSEPNAVIQNPPAIAVSPSDAPAKGGAQ